MLFNIRLVEADRERLGAPDPLPYDHGTMLVSEATALWKKAGLNRQTMIAALRDGDPEGRKAVTWLALRRAGIQVGYSELDFDIVDWRFELDQPEPDDADGSGDGEAEGNSGAPESGGQTPKP